MAFVLEFSEHQQAQRSRTAPPSRPQQPHKIAACLAELARGLETLNVCSLLECHDARTGSSALGFTVEAAGGVSALFRVSVGRAGGRLEVGASLLQGGSFCRLRSSEILKNLCRTVRSINGMASRCPVFLALGPLTRQLLLKTHASELAPHHLLPFLRSLLAEASLFLKSFSPLLLYSANLLPRSSLESHLQPSLRNFFFGPQGDFSRYSEIYEVMPLVNCALEVEREGEENEQKNSNPKRIVELYYDQKVQTDKQELALYCEPEPYVPEDPSFSFRKDAQALNFPTLRDGSADHPFIFNTISVSSHDKKRERIISEGGKAKIVASPTKFHYAKSMDVSHRESTKKSEELDEESTEETEETEDVQLDRVLLVKMPKVGPKEKEWKRLLDQISYEKEVLANLRTVGCAYIPKYYHSIQEKYEHRAFLLMDYVPGSTLAEEMERKRESLTASAKLHILSHLSNALRFLSQHAIAHLDLSPSNILVAKDFLVKLIDFGEAYHRGTSRKYAPSATRTPDYGRFVYSPGRTFPYAPPETSSRLDNFSSQQDMYSLGVIMHQLLFGTFPFLCAQDTHKRLYLDRAYQQRLFLAPQRAELYGQLDLITLLMSLTIKLLDEDEKRRPHPEWAHIIIKKLFYAIR